ncbi:MAG: hypothetical protein EOO71_07590 [Myxococcaceae bacterium]|nr:MAG: hypothetical protein EOO71_07590 [Myxococcaceae bacterium]
MVPGPDIVLACPRCGAPHRRGSLLSGNTFGAAVWTDGWRDAPMLLLPPLVSRCAACLRLFWVGRAHELGKLPSYWRDDSDSVTVVTLEAEGKRRVEVMQLLRSASGVSLHEVKRRIDMLPTELGRYFRRTEAKAFATRLESLGARVSLREETTELPQSLTPIEWKSAPQLQDLDESEHLEAVADGLAHGPDEEKELRLYSWWLGNAPYRRGAQWKPFSMRSPGARDNLLALAALFSPDEAMQRLLRAEALREMECFDEARALQGGEFPEPLNEAARFIQELALQRICEVRQLPLSQAGGHVPPAVD